VNKLRKAARTGAAAILLGTGVCLKAEAWGPSTRSALVSAAAHVLGQDPAFTLTRLQRYVTQGAELSPEEFEKLFPLFRIDPVGAIQREMVLLQSLRTDRIDPYYAFRMGALGRMAADATAPMAGAGSGAVRERYYADADKAIGRADLRMAARKLVDPRPYFAFVSAQASANDQTFEVEYKSGAGFGGLARATLPADASRSVNVVADVWYTLLTSKPSAFDEPLAAKRDFILGAIGFYVKQENMREAEASYALAKQQGLLDAQLQKGVADLFFDSAHYDRAMVEYQKILVGEPGRRDVVERVARFYEIMGDDALKREKLEAAREAYGKALEADSLHPDAQRKLLDVEAKMYARDERLAAQQTAIDEAHGFEDRAEEAAARRDYAMAIGLLRNAEVRYAKITDEFPKESKDAVTGRRMVELRTKELKRELIDNSMSLSGSGVAFDVRQIAGQTPDVSREAMKDMLQSEYRAAVRALGRQPDAGRP
jgi:tetratricopeptide (TPR) repeat protein